MIEYFFRRAFAYSLDILLIAFVVELVVSSKLNFQLEKYNETYEEYYQEYVAYEQHKEIEKIDSCDQFIEYVNKDKLIQSEYVDAYEKIEDLKDREETKSEFDEKCNKLVNNYNSYSITEDEYNDIVRRSNRVLEQNSVIYYVLTVVLSLLYFVFFQGFTGGQTLGKKFMRVKVISKNEKKDVSYKQLFLRTLFLNSIVYSVLILLGAYLLNDMIFTVFANVVTLVDTLVVGALMATVCFNKENKGLHDFLAETKVVVIDFKGNIIYGSKESKTLEKKM